MRMDKHHHLISSSAGGEYVRKKGKETRDKLTRLIRKQGEEQTTNFASLNSSAQGGTGRGMQ